MSTRPFLLGVLAGVAGSFVAGALLEPPPEPTPMAPDPQPAAESARQEDPAEPTADAPTAEHRPADASLRRTAVESNAEQPTEPSDRSARALEIQRLLEALCRDGTVASSFRTRTDTALGFLIKTLLRVDRPQEALALLQRHGRSGIGSEALAIGSALQAAGDTHNAREAFLIALRYGKRDSDTIVPLLRLDPTAARQALEATFDANGETLAMLRLFDSAPDQVERGQARIAELIEAGDLSQWSWRELLKARPEFVEKMTRKRLGNTELDEDDQARARDRLARALVALGKSKEAMTIAMASLEQNPDSDFRVELLADLDRDAAIAWTRKRSIDAPNQETFSAYGDQLMAAKRKREAFDAYAKAYSIKASSGLYKSMIRADPVLATNQLLPVAQTSKDDEMIGDVADALWKSGRTERAFALWRRALKLDSDDSEWIRKVQAVSEKRSPF